ncbi:MAG: hypothetical protein NC121_07210, partial [Blautia sp.]|nr:hypothetical protein [Blautia sp.]
VTTRITGHILNGQVSNLGDEQELHIRLGNTDKSAQRDEVLKLSEVPVDAADRLQHFFPFQN